jgi:hypothetical protein
MPGEKLPDCVISRPMTIAAHIAEKVRNLADRQIAPTKFRRK